MALGHQDVRALLAIAAEALGRYKLRTALSVLGVVLGVAAVIAMTSVSEGARREALDQVEALGLDNLVARNRGAAPDGESGLTLADAHSLPALVPQTVTVSPLIEKSMHVSRAGNGILTTAIGVRPSYQTILRLEVSRGRFISSLDERTAADVCVLGTGLARQLFGYEDPVNQFVRVRDKYFEVIGTLAEQGTRTRTIGSIAWRNLNYAVLLPLPSLSGRSLDVAPQQRVDEIWLQTENGDQVEAIGGVLGTALEKLHGGRRDVDVVVPRELLAQRYRTQRTFSVVVGSIAAIALLIGGIGIMNIMLTSVVERTHEIGIRRTVGATRNDITLQFLTESLLMTLVGGVLGIAIGVASALAITAYAGWSTYVSPVAVLLGITVSLSVGLIFGLYPAMKAARLEPVDALRYE
jgi:putative ABC transport system permease protein